MKETMGIITENGMKAMNVMRSMKIIANLPVKYMPVHGDNATACTQAVMMWIFAQKTVWKSAQEA